MMRRFWNSQHTVPSLILVILTLVYWAKVLFTGQVLLPGNMLAGFAPFGSHPNAPWNILQWDALGQYYPWRLFAARMLHQGQIPLWNPYQFSGAPFVANLQSAVFYPLNLPFWIFDVRYAFAISAALHTLLAAFGTYFLAQRWKLSRPASLLAAVGFAFCGYLAAWFVLPTLADTACWLPLLILLLEWTAERTTSVSERAFTFNNQFLRLALFSVALACAVLAGHVQIFLYIVAALILRALFLIKPFRALGLLILAGTWSFALAALQILPTLELAKLGHRAGGAGTMEAWQQFIAPRALQWSDLPSMFVPQWPFLSFNENFAYVGLVISLLAAIGIVVAIKRRSRPGGFVAVLAIFGLLYALATPLAEVIFLYVPGVAQMGGPGRALLLWSFGAAMLAAFALDGWIKYESGKSANNVIPAKAGIQNVVASSESNAIPTQDSRLPHAWVRGNDGLRATKSTFALSTIILLIVIGELFWNGQTAHPTSPASGIYPKTALTNWLQKNVTQDDRILFVTPKNNWLPTEVFQQNGRNHPSGVLPPNGAMVYGLHDVNGYDSLSPKAYRDFLVKGEGADVSPPLNGNMILINNINSSSLEVLHAHFVVTEGNLPQGTIDVSHLHQVWAGDGCVVYERKIVSDTPIIGGQNFYPGWKNGVYQPTTFRLGLFISLCAWFAVMITVGFCWSRSSQH
ncbi:MAG: hypothetical protein ABI210_07070 [Abditibacteriaceae bacterium]